MRKAAFFILLLTLIHLVMFTSCKSRIITNTITESKTTTIKERDTTFIYKGASVGAGVNLDSIINVLSMQFKQGLNGVEIKRSFVDPETKVKLSLWIDAYGRLQADCSSKDSAWEAKLQDVVTQYEKKTNQTEVIKERYIPLGIKILIGVLAVVAAITSAIVFWFLTQAIK